jgi:hypothetical protein
MWLAPQEQPELQVLQVQVLQVQVLQVLPVQRQMKV